MMDMFQKKTSHLQILTSDVTEFVTFDHFFAHYAQNHRPRTIDENQDVETQKPIDAEI
jgi:hypothetical protein